MANVNDLKDLAVQQSFENLGKEDGSTLAKVYIRKQKGEPRFEEYHERYLKEVAERIGGFMPGRASIYLDSLLRSYHDTLLNE